jgi:hypothetical protein
MRKLHLILMGLLAGAFLAGCGDSGSDEPPPKGDIPEPVTASPDMKTPEERGKMMGGGGEGS